MAKQLIPKATFPNFSIVCPARQDFVAVLNHCMRPNMPVIFEIGYLNLSNEVKKQSNLCWKFSDFRGFCVRMLRVRGIVNFVRHVSTIFRQDKSD